jgi:hypothetical protein
VVNVEPRHHRGRAVARLAASEKEIPVDVVAISTPVREGWHWRIVNYDGEVVEESPRLFPSIARAVEDGRTRLQAMDAVDVSERPSASNRAMHYRVH